MDNETKLKALKIKMQLELAEESHKYYLEQINFYEQKLKLSSRLISALRDDLLRVEEKVSENF